MDVKEKVQRYLDERWVIQPKGFIVSCDKVYDAIGMYNQREYGKVAKILENLGGIFFGIYVKRGLAVKSNSRYIGASKWQFIAER